MYVDAFAGVAMGLRPVSRSASVGQPPSSAFSASVMEKGVPVTSRNLVQRQ